MSDTIPSILINIPITKILSLVWDQEFYDSLKYMTQANKIVHGNKNGAGIGHTTKMNCYSWGIPASACKTGSILAKDSTSSCHGCYAKHGNYMYNDVQDCYQKRLKALDNDHWVEAITFLINKRNPDKGQFRWFDSGDLQNHDHFVKIINVCEHSQQVKHWLPTQEHELIVEHILAGWNIPKNLTVRLSARKKNGEPPTQLVNYLNQFPNVKGYIGTSNVGDRKYWEADLGACPSSLNDNQCGSCTKCWARVPNIMYKKH